MSSENSDKRRGSILSLWKTGKDVNGKHHVHSGHGEDWEEVIDPEDIEPGSEGLLVTDSGDRRGSVLHYVAMEEPEGGFVEQTPPKNDSTKSPFSISKETEKGERQGSVLSIWRHGKDKDGISVIKSGEEHEGPIVLEVEKIGEVEKPRGQERRGSVLSMWTQGKDKHGNDSIFSGFEDEHEEPADPKTAALVPLPE
jgi:hypothetical protein